MALQDQCTPEPSICWPFEQQACLPADLFGPLGQSLSPSQFKILSFLFARQALAFVVDGRVYGHGFITPADLIAATGLTEDWVIEAYRVLGERGLVGGSSGHGAVHLYAIVHSRWGRPTAGRRHHAEPKRVEPKRYDLLSQVTRANATARRLGLPDRLTVAQWRAVKEQQGNICLRCRKPEGKVGISLDHVRPLSKGGSNTPDNLQCLCLPCNFEKRTHFIDYRTVIGDGRPGL